MIQRLTDFLVTVFFDYKRIIKMVVRLKDVRTGRGDGDTGSQGQAERVRRTRGQLALLLAGLNLEGQSQL